MASYVYSRWKNAAGDFPLEFYSELDARRFETRKVEVFRDGRLGFAAQNKNAHGTRLGEIAVPSLVELKLNFEVATVEINREEFERKWSEALGQRDIGR